MFIWPFGKRRAASKALVDLQHMDAPLSREVAAILAGAGVPTFRQALPALTAELERARRYDRPLAIALVTDARVTADQQHRWQPFAGVDDRPLEDGQFGVPPHEVLS